MVCIWIGKNTIRPDICSVLLLGLSVADTDGEDEPEDSPQPLSENSEGIANELLEATAMSRYSVFLSWILLMEDIKLHQWLVLYLPGGSFPSIPENTPTLLVCCYIILFNFCPDIWSDVLCPRDLTGGNLSLPEGISGGSNTGVVQLADLQRILSGIGQPPGKFLYPPHFHVTGNGSPLSFFFMDRYWFVCLTNYILDEHA